MYRYGWTVSQFNPKGFRKDFPMSRGMIRLSVLSGVFVLMAGCGGSSSGGSSSGGSGGGGGENSTTVTFTITNGTPTAVATKIGSGAFTAATLTGNKLTLSLPSGTTNFAVAYVCQPSNSAVTETNEYVVEASTLDGTSFSESCRGTTSSTGATGTLTGTVDASAISGVQYVYLYAQNSTAGTSDGGTIPNGSFSFAAPEGTDRVEVVEYDSTQSGNAETISMVAAKNFTGVSVPGVLNGGNPVEFGTSDAATSEPITYNNVPSGFSSSGFSTPTTFAFYYMGDGAFAIAYNATTAYPAMPAGAMESGDYYSFQSSIQGANAGATNGYASVNVETTSTTSGPVAFTFPPAWSYAGPAAAKWPSFNFAYTGFSGAAAADVCDEVFTTWYPSSTATNYVEVDASGNYLAGSTTVAIPDLSSVTGFVAAPASNTKVSWGADVLQLEHPCFQPSSVFNSTWKWVETGGTYTAP
jgi:hypothetical protein